MNSITSQVLVVDGLLITFMLRVQHPFILLLLR